MLSFPPMSQRILLTALLCAIKLCHGAQPVIDNEQVTVWDLTGDDSRPVTHAHDFVAVYLTPSADGKHELGDVVFAHSGVFEVKQHERIVFINLKDYKLTPSPNTTGYPLAFPRAHAIKLIDNDRVTVWSYHWQPGEPTPMHFHDKNTVVVFMEDTNLRSTTPDGNNNMNSYAKFETRFMLRNRIHSEVLVKGTGSGIMTELK